MRLLTVALLILLIVFQAIGQVSRSAPVYRGKRSSDPATCSVSIPTWYFDTVSNTFKYCSATNTWSSMGGTTLPTTFTSTGDTYTTPALKLDYKGWDGSQYTTGLWINATDASSYFSTAIRMSNTGYNKNGIIQTSGTNGLTFSSLGADTQFIFADQSVIAGIFSTDSTLPSLKLNSISAGRVPLSLQLAASQSADALQIKDSSANTLFAINYNGNVQIGSPYFNLLPSGSISTVANAGILSDSNQGSFILRTSATSYFTDTLNNDIILRNTSAGIRMGVQSGTSDFSITSAGIGRFKNGANVASAAAIVPTGNVFHVTGTTSITSITSTGIEAGTCIVIIFDGALTFTDGSNLKLAGNFVTTADDTIQLCYDGTNWFETKRSVN